MAKVASVLLIVLNGLLITGAVPQYGPGGGGGGGSYGGNSGGSPPPPPPPPPPPSSNGGGSYGGNSGGSAGPSGGSNGGSSGSSSGGGSGGPLTVQCRGSPDSSGNIKYDCSGVNKDAVTLKTEHVLWLENQAGTSQNLDIEIPNYNFDELIKAAYKELGPQEGAKINILLKKPDVTYNAEKGDQPKASVGAPAVSVNYQPVDKISVHYPTQKQYSNGGGSSSSSGSASAGGNGGSVSSFSANGGGSGSASSFSGNNGGGSSFSGSNGGGNGGSYGGSSGGGGGNGGSYGGNGGNGGSSGGGAYSRPQRGAGYRYYFVRQ